MDVDSVCLNMRELNGLNSPLKLGESQKVKTLKLTNSTSTWEQVGSSNQSEKKGVVERVNPDGLPPGWIKELRVQKKDNKTRKDPYYTDAVSGYVFFSHKDVLRYLETGDLNSCATKPRKRDELGFLNEETSVPSTTMKQKLGHHATRRELFSGTENSVASSSKTMDAEGLLKRQTTSVSADVMTAATPTAETSKGKSSLDNVVECAETRVSNDPSSLLPSAEGSKRKLGAENGSLFVPSTDIIGGENGEDNGLDNNRETDSRKSKNKKARIFPCRTSKRLAGLKPEMVGNLAFSEQALRTADKTSGQNEGKPSLGTLDNVAHTSPQQFQSVSKTQIADRGLRDAEAQSIDLSDRSKKSLEDQVVPDDQPARHETVKKDEENIKSQHLYPFGDSWSDPCLEFAYKTLTGAITVEDDHAIRGHFQQQEDSSNVQEGSRRKQGKRVCAGNGTFSSPLAQILREENLEEIGLEKNSSRKPLADSGKSKNKKELKLPCRSSKRLAGHKPEMVANWGLSEHAIRAAVRNSGENDAKPSQGALDNIAHSSPQQCLTIPERQIADDALIGTEAKLDGEMSNRSKKRLEDQVVMDNPLVRQETENKDGENIESQSCYPFGVSWSDPCLEFAFKTLTGEINIEDDPMFQGHFHQQVNSSHSQGDTCLGVTEVGLPIDLNNDISSLPIAKDSKREQDKRVPAENGVVSTPSTEIIQMENLGKNILEENINRNAQTGSSKPKNKKFLQLPSRSSKRLAGIQPEMAMNWDLREQALRAAARGSGRSEMGPSAEALDDVARRTSQQCQTGSETATADHTLRSTEAPSDVELANKNKRSLEDQAAPEALGSVANSASHRFLSPDYAFRGTEAPSNVRLTNRRAMSLEDQASPEAIDITVQPKQFQSVFKADIADNALRLKEAPSNVELKSIGRLLEGQAALGSLDNVVHSIPLQFHPVLQTGDHACTEAPSNIKVTNRSEKPLEDRAVQELAQSVRQEAEKKDKENQESKVLYPFGDIWSDPCLDFAFKTLTGAIPFEDNLQFQSYFQHGDSSHSQDEDCSAAPSFSIPNFFQTDTSSNSSAPGKPVPAPWSSIDPMFLPPGNAILPGCSGTIPQQPNLDGSQGHHHRKNS
ncbi:uncharacterized protein LOC127812655 isoform X2 [Diospyros lotus]|nr:uncharacterized protein LOC127812655 isoform X2 [Diospyros lotus]